MKTQDNKLGFSKSSLVELNATELNDVNGGSYITVSIAITIYTITRKLV